MVLCLGEPPRRFLWCLVVVLHFIFVSSFHFCISISFLIFICRCSSFCRFLHLNLLFDIIPHLSVDYRRVFTPVLYFQPSPSESDSRYFHFQLFRYFLTASATFLSRRFLPSAVFYLTLLHQHFNLHLSRLPWEPAVLPWSLQGFILILETKTRPIHSNPQSSYSERFSFKFYNIFIWITCDEKFSL